MASCSNDSKGRFFLSSRRNWPLLMALSSAKVPLHDNTLYVIYRHVKVFATDFLPALTVADDQEVALGPLFVGSYDCFLRLQSHKLALQVTHLGLEFLDHRGHHRLRKSLVDVLGAVHVP